MNVISALAAGRKEQAVTSTIRQFNMLFGEGAVKEHNENLISTLGLPVFKQILGRNDLNVSKITVGDTINILRNMDIGNTNSELLFSLKTNDLNQCINNNNKLHVLAYASTLIGKCMNAEATLTATTMTSEPVFLDLSRHIPKPLEAPKKPNWFVRHLTFLSDSFKERMNNLMRHSIDIIKKSRSTKKQSENIMK